MIGWIKVFIKHSSYLASSFNVGETKDDVKAMKFNETCCALSGVPEECMGLCRARHRRSISADLPTNQCDEHLKTIHSCVYEGIIKLSYSTSISLHQRLSIWQFIHQKINFAFNRFSEGNVPKNMRPLLLRQCQCIRIHNATNNQVKI